MKFDVNVATFALAMVCAVSGWVVWWIDKIHTDKERIQTEKLVATQRAAEAAKKEYAAQRDFEHLKNNLKQLAEGLSNGFDGLEERFDQVDKELLRIEAYLINYNKPNRDNDFK